MCRIIAFYGCWANILPTFGGLGRVRFEDLWFIGFRAKGFRFEGLGPRLWRERFRAEGLGLRLYLGCKSRWNVES